MTSFQPFLISEFKTGLFNYLEPWIRPQEAFEPLENAFVYRGQLQKRQGYTFFGYMAYQDSLTSGNGGKTYSGTLATKPIIPGSFSPTDGVETFIDNGSGTLTGSAGGSGTIDYTTGAWTLSFNANVNVGVVIIAGFYPNIGRPIMGIKTWTNETTITTKLVIGDTRRLAVYSDNTGVFVPLNGVSQTIYVAVNSTGAPAVITPSINTSWAAVIPYTNVFTPFTVSITDGISIITDDGAGNLSSSGAFNAGGTVNYSTGVVTLNYTVPGTTTRTITMTVTLAGDYFNGTTANFFNSTNWMGKLYLTNNVDPITLYDGSTSPGTLSRPPFSITLANYQASINNIGAALDVDVYKNRFLVERPTIINAGGQNGIGGQSIRWSAQFNPTNLAADVAGNGGETSAPTDDFIQSTEFLRDVLVVFFLNTDWIFRFTGSQFDPFRWDKISSTKSTNAPYGTIPYDERITAMGAKGLIACDAVNVQRYDLNIIDEFLEIDQFGFAQCFGIRFDSINQSWMLFPSDGSTTGLSDSVLVYNFLENTWSVYSIPMSCLGLYHVTKDARWEDFAVGQPLGTDFPNWEIAQFPWNSYLLQALAPNLLGGGFDGVVYQLNTGTDDNGGTIEANITSARWNPFSSIGQKVQFGWIDFYYTIDPHILPATLILTFYTDNTSSPTAERVLTLDGPTNSDVAWKRIYINNIGEFLRMNINTSSPASWKILGMIMWAKPSGRFTP